MRCVYICGDCKNRYSAVTTARNLNETAHQKWPVFLRYHKTCVCQFRFSNPEDLVNESRE
jgi:hypothetical protein